MFALKKLLSISSWKQSFPTAIRGIRFDRKKLKSPVLPVLSERRDNDVDAPIDMPNPFEREKKMCILCKLKMVLDYKNVRLLSQFQSSFTGRIYSRNVTGLCKWQQQQVERAIRRAQRCGLMPYYHKNVHYMKDPRLFDPERPLRSHPY